MLEYIIESVIITIGLMSSIIAAFQEDENKRWIAYVILGGTIVCLLAASITFDAIGG